MEQMVSSTPSRKVCARRSWIAARLVSLHKTENHISDALISNHGVQHAVIYRTVGPFGIEIFLDEIRALTVDGIHQFFRIFFTLATAKKPPDFIFPRSVQKDPQSIRPVLKKLL